MGSSALADRDTVLGALDAMEAASEALAVASLDGFSPAELLDISSRLEVLARRAPAVDHRILGQLTTRTRPGELGATSWGKVLAERLRISAADAGQRIADAADLGPRTAVTGEPLEPVWPHLAAAQATGAIGVEHVRITRKFFKDLPASVDATTRVAAEKDLARVAATCTPEEYRNAVTLMLALLHPDGDFDDNDRQRRRGIRIGPQGADGLSAITGTLTPEARAVFEPILAKLAAPGMCNPDDPEPCVAGRPTQAQIDADHRCAAQRTHDAFLAAGRIVLSTKSLGELNGLPVTVIVSTTLAELEAGAGMAVTGGGSRMPMPDLIRTAAEAYHYLVIFDGNGKALFLDRTRRTASAAQRIALHARDIGCTKPGCAASGYQCQAHHLGHDWADGGLTNVNELTLACGPDNRMATEFGWNTHLNKHGRVEWTPPPHLDHNQPRINSMHHPKDLLGGCSEPDPPPPPVLTRPRPAEPDPHDDDIHNFLVALDGADHPNDYGPDDLRRFYYDMFGTDRREDGDAVDDFLMQLDPDLLLAMDPDRDLIDEDRWTLVDPRL